MAFNYGVGPVDGLGDTPHLSMVTSHDGGSIEDFLHGELDRRLADSAALLFRGFGLTTDDEFADLVSALAREELVYAERSTTRTVAARNVYTSTEYPSAKTIAGHSENSFQNIVPGKIAFFAKRPSPTGGETPFASNTEILRRLDPHALAELRAHGVRYVRNFDGGFDLSWQEAFQTDDPGEVDAYCHAHAIDATWVSSDHLRTAQDRPATRRHPVTGVEVWFNQLHLFHSSNLEPAMRSALLSSLGEDGLPRNAVRGDGAPWPDDLVGHVRQTIAEAEVAFPWQRGDVLIADNLLISHGRRPYTGDREVRVALIDPVDFTAVTR